MAETLRADPARIGRAAVVQLIEGHALSGRLAVEYAGAEIGWADFVDGRPVQAVCGSVEGVDALFDLLTVDVDVVRFGDSPAGRLSSGEPLVDVLSWVMEGSRLRDEFVRLAGVVATAADVPLRGTSPELQRAVAQLDGRRTIGDAVRRASLSPSRVIDGLRGLFESRILVQRAARAPMLRTPVGFYEALESGRRHLRAGDLDRAEAHLLAAVGLRPHDRIALQNLRRVRELRAREWIERGPRSWRTR